MLTNTKEYHDLKISVADYLRIDVELIYSIANPMRQKSIPYILVGIEGIKKVLLKIEGNSYKRI